MNTVTQHPIVIWVCIIGGFLTVTTTCIGAFLYLEALKGSNETLHDELRKGLQDKKKLDDKWLDLDRFDHSEIMRLETEILHEIELFGERYKTDNSLLYQLGLRDGQALCKER